jgi:hypothetical protein
LDKQTTGKVNTALKGDPLASAPPGTQKVAEKWALEGADGNPREFANRYEYARAKYSDARNAAADEFAGTQDAKAKAANKAAAEITPEKLTNALSDDIELIKKLPPGENLHDLPPDASPDDIAKAVQKLGRITYETDTAEAYHALKHKKELKGVLPEANKNQVHHYATAADDTIRNGAVVKAEPAEGGSTLVIIQKEYMTPEGPKILEAIIYVKPDGKVTLASYGEAKAK